MPKNKGKGGKNRRRGKNENEDMKRELVFKEDGQEYAQVGSRWSTFCSVEVPFPSPFLPLFIKYLSLSL
jgi:translation initiation factor 1A